MHERDYYGFDDEDPWESVRLTREAIRARASLILYTALISAPFVALTAIGAFASGLQPHEVLGVSCYNAMVSSLLFFDTLRNAAHDCFDKAVAEGLVTCSAGIPVIDPAFRHRRLARLSFAVGGRTGRKRT
ncbi:hypothetical protein [Geomesophilobacter sediminis]|uniref:Uncharacterized protein n=1 Tax=Geomesophilobacter sediminis TaxID=2798584 RepID=A0A8J7IQ29_9BACT|nr:hypothetical protein [Geomesophilobacter sediminis]MBJ6724639.1 hypothetical protein [Geomesophilobacter sediminis]